MAIDMYGYGMAARRIEAVEGLTPRSAASAGTPLLPAPLSSRSRCSSARRSARSSSASGGFAIDIPGFSTVVAEGSRRLITPRFAQSGVAPSLSERGLRPKQLLDMRAQLSLASQRLMEVAELSCLQAADLVAADDRSSHDGVINVHESWELDSAKVTELAPHTRLHVVDSRRLDDGTKRVLVLLEGENAPLGWATGMTPDGLPLIYLYARPLYEVVKKPLKVRKGFDQLSRFVKQLQIGTRMHIMETRRDTDGAQRVCVVVIGEDEQVGWVTAKRANGMKLLAEVPTDAAGGGSPARPSSPGASRFDGMSFDALEQAAIEFISQQHTFLRSSTIREEMADMMHSTEEVEAQLKVKCTSFFEGGEKNLSVMLGEHFFHHPATMDQIFAEAEGDGANGRISMMEFRMYLRKLLDMRDMLSSMEGASEIDSVFPTVERNGDGTLDEEEISIMLGKFEDARVAFEESLKPFRARVATNQGFLARAQATLKIAEQSERAFTARAEAVENSTGARLGELVKSKEEDFTITSLAIGWTTSRTGESVSVDRAAFRHAVLALGFQAEAPEIDRLFESLGGGEMSTEQLEEALAMVLEQAEAARPMFRQLNGRIIETSKAIKSAYIKHKEEMARWMAYRSADLSADRERAARRFDSDEVKLLRRAGVPASAPAAASAARAPKAKAAAAAAAPAANARKGGRSRR